MRHESVYVRWHRPVCPLWRLVTGQGTVLTVYWWLAAGTTTASGRRSRSCLVEVVSLPPRRRSPALSLAVALAALWLAAPATGVTTFNEVDAQMGHGELSENI